MKERIALINPEISRERNIEQQKTTKKNNKKNISL
jgi:hypothetical protein